MPQNEDRPKPHPAYAAAAARRWVYGTSSGLIKTTTPKKLRDAKGGGRGKTRQERRNTKEVANVSTIQPKPNKKGAFSPLRKKRLEEKR